MDLSRLNKKVLVWLRGRKRTRATPPPPPSRQPISHVIILDGTMSSLVPGRETNAGLTYKLLSGRKGISLYYEPGIQWTDWNSAVDVMMGRGINRQIRRAYGFLASRYRPGDRIYLMGFSRGAFAVRSLAGVIDMVGLLKPEAATERNIRDIYRHYECTPCSDHAKAFAQRHCHSSVSIEMIGVWDTVKALGLSLPILWRLTEPRHKFHNHHLGGSVRNGFHALALHETRMVYEPVLWDRPEEWGGRVDQVWFPGTHGDIGGQLSGFEPARPLANVSLVWMLERAEACGLTLPQDWRKTYQVDAMAPSVGSWRGFGKLFWLRRRRRVGANPSEHNHPTVAERANRPMMYFRRAPSADLQQQDL